VKGFCTSSARTKEAASISISVKETHLEQTMRDFARFKIKSQSDNLLLRARSHFLANVVTFSIANRENWHNIVISLIYHQEKHFPMG